MIYTESQSAWLDRRALQVQKRTGWPLPIARSEAAAELARMRARPACAVVDLKELAQVEENQNQGSVSNEL